MHNLVIQAGAYASSHPKQRQLAMGMILILVSCYYFWGIAAVPFHPDESTYLYMSSDFKALLTDPVSLFWNPNSESDLKQHYREIDPPLTRDLIGAGLAIAGLKPLANDWDWTKTWQENVALNAFPTESQLIIGRLSVAWLFPLSLVLIFMSGRKLSGTWFGLLASLLYLSNALVMLHTRRAMEEGPMLFGICLALWGLLNLDKGPWLAALGSALAFNSKQSALALVPIILIGFFLVNPPSKSFRNRLSQVVIYLAIFCAITLILNPFLWNDPVQAAKAAIANRLALVQNQINAIEQVAPQQVLSSPTERMVGLIAQLFIAPPAIQDIGNYSQELSQSTTIYLNLFGTDLFRGLVWGGLGFALTLLGMIQVLVITLKGQLISNRLWILLLAGFWCQTIALMITVQVPFQRYWVPLIPFLCLFIVKGMELILETGKMYFSQLRKKRSLAS